MKVRGFKVRVQLSEEQLEHVERKPGFSLTPMLAALIWIGSMLAAAAIYFDWTPFGVRSDGATSAATTIRPPVAERAVVRSATPATPRAVTPVPEPPKQATADSASPASETPADSTAQRTERPVLRDRKIRGSYAGSREDWLAGW